MYNRSMQTVLETEPPRSLSGEPGPFRMADYLTLPEDWSGELLWGHLVVTPAPGARHQFVLVGLTRRLSEFALAHGHLLLVAPSDVTLFEHTVCQPDLLLVDHDRREIVADRVEGAPDLAIEILSPSSGRRDRMIKLALYARARVPEYWIVDPVAQTIDFLVLENDSYRFALADGSQYQSHRFPGLEIDLDELWDEVDRLATGRLPD